MSDTRFCHDLEEDLSANYDVVFLQRGRSVTILSFVFLNAQDELERKLTRKLAARLG